MGKTMTTPSSPRPSLRADDLTVAYGNREVLHRIELTPPDGKVTAIVGPNGCGKSTLLKTLARVLAPASGAVWLDGESIHRLPSRQVARQLGLLPQSTVAPEQLTVADLVGRGRYPHRGPFGRWTDADRDAVDDALAATATAELRERPVDELSGGQRQRVWIAMVLAQQTPLLLLDEPTTYLDLAHRLEVLRLLRRLNTERGVTVVMVLHDLHEATRYADHLVAMGDGQIIAEGHPADILTPQLVLQVFGVACTTVPDPVSGNPLVVPLEHPEHPPAAARDDTAAQAVAQPVHLTETASAPGGGCLPEHRSVVL
jgi:ABC-type cobalamin/Fe3+-siderophores transport system ATPase subunit